MNVLGIETSCDETAAAVVEDTGVPEHPWRARSNIVASQVEIHREWGGVVPELSARQHVHDICDVVERALAGAGVKGCDAIAVTQGPGLVGSLLVGLSFAKALAWARGVPLIPVHHLAGHIESLVLENGELPYPAIVLVVSGGHTSLFRVETPGTYELLGRTRDDAAGEAYDKVGKLLDLGYPGGPAVDRLAGGGDDRAVPFPKTRLTHADRNAPHLPGRRDFSFSGLKTSVLRHVARRRVELGLQESDAMPDEEVANVCASFQRVVVETLLDRVFEAAKAYGALSVGIAGGVPVFTPSLPLATDNAAMIAAAGLRRYRTGLGAAMDVNAEAGLTL
jgi:N6-L-threonylcarbamoyladenine synthase